MVGSAIVRRLDRESCTVITAPRGDVDLIRQDQVDRFLEATRPQAVFMAAAKVGGILRQRHVSGGFPLRQPDDRGERHRGPRTPRASRSCCSSVRRASIPSWRRSRLRKHALLTGPLEPTNEWYAIAKIAGIKLAQAYRRQHGCDFISAMPTNLYGPGDNFDLATSHVLPALIRKAHEAKLAGARPSAVWGTGSPAARVPACRRLRRRARTPHERLFRGRAHQRRLGPGSLDCGSRAAWSPRSSAIEGEIVFRCQRAGRDAAQADGQREARGARLATAHPPRRRDRADVRTCSWRRTERSEAN